MMKKFVLGIALIALSATAVSAAPTSSRQDNKTNTEKSEMKKGDRKKGNGKKGENHGPRNIEDSKAFQGINLTDAQKAKLQELKKANRAQAEAKKEEMKNLSKEDRQKMKEEKMAKMKSLSSEEREKMKNEMQAKRLEGKKKYLDGIKSVLTPEQYTLFLENVYVYGNNPGKGHGIHNHDGKGKRMHGHSAKAGKMGKGMRNGKKESRENKKTA